jgi:hypothetical protein
VAPQTKLQKARLYILAHPDESKEQQAAGTGCSVALIAIARKGLVEEGKLAPSRKAASVLPDATPAEPAPPSGMLDHDAMMALADMSLLEDLDDDEVQKRMLKQCIRFAFDPKLHADTRMSASVQWGKLRDAVKIRDLGPGPPLTRAMAFDRYKDLTSSIADVDFVVEVLFASYPAADVVRALSSRLEAREEADGSQAHTGDAGPVLPATEGRPTAGA